MTNLLEKSLLTGFGVITLITFLSFITPIFSQLSYIQNQNQDLQKLLDFIEEVDQGVNSVLDNTELTYINIISYPKDLNITLNGQFIKYDYKIKDAIKYKIYEYEKYFYTLLYQDVPTGDYYLNISVHDNKIDFQLTLCSFD